MECNKLSPFIISGPCSLDECMEIIFDLLFRFNVLQRLPLQRQRLKKDASNRRPLPHMDASFVNNSIE